MVSPMKRTSASEARAESVDVASGKPERGNLRDRGLDAQAHTLTRRDFPSVARR
jgi:hypothetical protein